ncbi:MAG: hypothetical protein IJ572_04130 [Bacilli bacterium]|nr:hypothetical protein [Bacilli bacterium]
MDKIKNSIYYIAFSLLVIVNTLLKSVLIQPPVLFFQVTYVLITILFLVKIILDKPNIKESIIYVILLILMIYLYYITRNKFLVLNLLAFISIKNIDIKKIIKIDIIIKLLFILSHSIFYFYDYIFNNNNILELIHTSSKGTSLYLYFINPNFTSYLVFAIVFDYLFLQEKINIKKIIICTLLIIITFIITRSRTPFIMYLLLLLFYLIKNKKLINCIYYSSYIILSFISLYFLKFSFHTPIYYKLNDLLSGRFGYPRLAFEEIGLSLIPSSSSMQIYGKYIVDNFYDMCFLFLGVITLLIYLVPIIMTPKKGFEKEKKFIIICIIYLFFETLTIKIGVSIFLLLIANIIYNRKGEVKNESNSYSSNI